MSKLALAEFDKARILQTTQNDAGRIRRGVAAAKQRLVRAGVRWPFELMQNAHDAGPRDDHRRVEVAFVLGDDQLVVSHTGKPFVAQELAALLSGGSSKEFDSEETTGRFGTGFLVTHALSTRVDVDGVLNTEEGPEIFHVELERDGDEDSIAGNIGRANQALERAQSVSASAIAGEPTASLVYHLVNFDVAKRGLGRLEQALPYLYATCSKLGSVRIELSGELLLFEPVTSCEDTVGDFVINETHISISSSNTAKNLVAVRVGRKDGQSALLAVLERRGLDEYQVLLPGEDFSRIFVTFPIAETDFLPFNVILDGKFAPDQERDGIAMHDADKELIDEALSAFPTLVQHAVESGWLDAHNLAHLAVPDRPLSGESESGEMEWWHEALLRVAEQTAAMSIVKTESGLLPALNNRDGLSVSFLVPAIDADAPECVDYDTVHKIASDIEALHIPSEEVAQSWGAIARQWARIGAPIERLGLDELATWLKDKAGSVDDLPVQGDHFAWLANLFLLAADMNDQNVRDVVNGLLPDQYGKFRNTEEEYLYADGGISEEIKDISSELGEDMRTKLLHDDMARALAAPGFENANTLIRGLLDKMDDGEYTESKAIDRLLDSLATRLPHDSEFDDDTGLSALRASARLVAYLVGSGDDARVRRCPLLTAADNVVHLTGNQQILAPKLHWPESEQPYAGLYTSRRLLSDRYCDDVNLTQALDELIAVHLVIAAPLFYGRRAEIEDVNLLREMSRGVQETAGVTVRDTSFGQIAFLATDLVNRCAQDIDLAKLLLDFVLNVAAPEDQNWRKTESVLGNRLSERVNLSLSGATWPAELKVRAWIPVRSADDEGNERITPMPANESHLREILDPAWLKGNRDAVDLLHQAFGFRELTLMLDSLDSEIENDLVELLQDPELVRVAANQPEAVRFASELESADVTLDSVREFVREIREQKRKTQDIQELGFGVETLVKESLELAGFSVRRTGIGSDFEIAMELGDVANLQLTKGEQSWLVEVKSTREQKVVRMSDTQAKTAAKEKDRYLLCVVPVELETDVLDLDDVLASMRFVADVGGRVIPLCDNLGDFEELRDDITAGTSSGVQLEISPGPARVRVNRSVWENDGFPLDDLAENLSSR